MTEIKKVELPGVLVWFAMLLIVGGLMLGIAGASQYLYTYLKERDAQVKKKEIENEVLRNTSLAPTITKDLIEYYKAKNCK